MTPDEIITANAATHACEPYPRDFENGVKGMILTRLETEGPGYRDKFLLLFHGESEKCVAVWPVEDRHIHQALKLLAGDLAAEKWDQKHTGLPASSRCRAIGRCYPLRSGEFCHEGCEWAPALS